MISLINGHIQNVSNSPIVPLGYVEFYLNTDATLIAAPYGQILGGVTNSIKFYFDENADIIVPAQLWSNLELNPQLGMRLGTWYVVNFYDQNGTRLNNAPQTWQFTQPDGATVDIGQMVSTSRNTIYYPTYPLFAPQTNSWINVKSFGAIGDGSHDDTYSIQSAFDSTAPTHGIVYFPAGTYKITEHLTNPSTLSGIIGDGARISTIVGSTLGADVNALDFVDIPIGFRVQDIGVTGPGQAGGGSGIGISLAVSIVGNIIYQLDMTNVFISDFQGCGLLLHVPIVSWFNNVVAQDIGDTGFVITFPAGGAVAGTSTTWNNCYANNCLGEGYYFEAHVYSVMNSCAADTCNDSYHFYQCGGITMNSCGNEANTYISPSLPGRGVVIEQCYGGMVSNGHWQYFLPNILSVGMALLSSTNVTVNGFYNVPNSSVPTQTYDITIDVNCSTNTFINPMASGKTVATVHDLGGANLILQGNLWPAMYLHQKDSLGNCLQTEFGVTVNGVDNYGNCLTTIGGNIVMTGTASSVSLELFQTGNGYPKFAITNNDNAVMAWGYGAAPTDIHLTRFGSTTPFGLALTMGASCAFEISNSAEANYRVALTNDSAGLLFTDGTNAADLSCWRSAAGTLSVGTGPGDSSGTLRAGVLIEATSHTPATSTDTGIAGQIAWDANYIYVCINTNTWRRSAIAGW